MSTSSAKRFPEPVILLAAGLGTRMAPLTLTTPKPLVPVANIALIDHVIRCFSCEGANQFAINAHHLLEQMATHISRLPNKFPDAKFALSPEPDQLRDTGGGAKQALELVEGDPVFVANTDAFWKIGADKPLNRMRAQHDRAGGIVLLCAHPTRATGFRRSHDFCLAPDAKVTNDRGVPVIYTGVALFDRQEFDGTPETPFSFADILFAALDKGQLTGVMLDTPWMHVGDPAAIAEAEKNIA